MSLQKYFRLILQSYEACTGLFFLQVAFLLAGFLPLTAQTPLFTKSFSPGTIGPGSMSRLTFTITNESANGISGLQFEDKLPEGVVIASPANIISDCEGTINAPDGGDTINFSEGRIQANSSCTISVNVTSSVNGTHTNLSGELISDAGNSGTATADLTVTVDRPGFTKSFSPSQIAWGGRSTLTFTIDNTNNSSERKSLTFTDILPEGIVVADPSNAVITCEGGKVVAKPGSNLIEFMPTVTFLDASVSAGQVCTVSVDVIGESLGTFHSMSGELSSNAPLVFEEETSGFAAGTLTVTSGVISLRKSFLEDPAIPGGTLELEYTITNRSREGAATGISFTDDLSSILEGLVSTGLPQSDICGSGSMVSGTSVITFSGGQVAAGESCTFNVSLIVPVNAENGLYPSVTSAVIAMLDGNTLEVSPATDTLTISPLPQLTMEFIDDPTTAGSTVTLEFTITNQSRTFPASDMAFNFLLPPELSQPDSLPEDGFCGPESKLMLFPLSSDSFQLDLTGGSLEANESCSFQLIFDINPTASEGILETMTSPITATIDEVTVSGAPARDELVIVSAPRLTKSFLDSSVQPGEKATLRFTLTHNSETQDTATGISFTDNLEEFIPGAVATGLPQNNLCGTGSSLNGTSLITFQGGTLSPGQTCSFDVEIIIPASAALGSYSNITSLVSAQVGGLDVGSSAAQAELLVSSLAFTQSFLDLPVIPGGTSRLEFTIRNNSQLSATNIAFTNDLNAVLEGMIAVGLPKDDICGAGSQISGTEVIIMTGGSLGPGKQCVFSIDVLIPPETLDGQYVNATSDLTVSLGEQNLLLPPATAVLDVTGSWLQIRNDFKPNPAIAGSTTKLEFTITNLHPTLAIQAIAFTDELPAGLIYNGEALLDICGTGSQLSGTSTLNFTGGSLPAGDSCTISIPLQVPVEAPASILNTTSELTGQIDELPVRGDPWSNSLETVNIDIVRATTLGSPEFDVTDNLIRQQIEVSNSNALAVSGFRLVVSNLPQDVMVENATGINNENLAFIDWLQPLQPDESVIVTIEFKRPSGNPDFEPIYLLVFTLPDGSSTAQAFDLAQFELLSDGTLQFEWPTTPGRLYAIEWSDDMSSWLGSGEPIFAVTKRIQWIDDGPPKTPSIPLDRPRRFYRVIEMED